MENIILTYQYVQNLRGPWPRCPPGCTTVSRVDVPRLSLYATASKMEIQLFESIVALHRMPVAYAVCPFKITN